MAVRSRRDASPEAVRALIGEIIAGIRLARPAEALLLRGEAACLRYLSDPGRLTLLGFSSIGDLASQLLRMKPRTARDRVRLEGLLRGSPILQEAFLRGELTSCQILALGPMLGEDAAAWIETARGMSVREIRAKVREARGDRGEPEPSEGRLVRFPAPLPFLGVWREAMELARKVLGADAPQYRCVEAMLREGGLPGAVVREEEEGEMPRRPTTPPGIRKLPVRLLPVSLEALSVARRALEELAEYRDEVASLLDSDPPQDPWEAIDRLRQLGRLRKPMRGLTGRLLRGLFHLRAPEYLGYARLSDFVEQEMGLSERTARDLVGKAFVFGDYPALEAAYARGEIGMGAAYRIRQLARGGDIHLYLARAREVTCRHFEREARFLEHLRLCVPELAARFPGPLPHRGLMEAMRERLTQGHGYSERMLAAEVARRGGTDDVGDGSADPAEDPLVMLMLETMLDLLSMAAWEDAPPEMQVPGERQTSATSYRTVWISFWAPHEIADDWDATVEKLRSRQGRELPIWVVATSILRHAAKEWEQQDPERKPVRLPILKRDQFRCQVPACTSRRHLVVHHVWPRGEGGGDEEENQVTLCHCHHDGVIHAERGSVRGRAPRALRWELGIRPGGLPPLLTLVGDKIVQAT